VFHQTTQRFLRGKKDYFPAEDPLICLQRDVYDFALKAVKHVDRVEVHKLAPPALQKSLIKRRSNIR
jgi:hypothetical protein